MAGAYKWKRLADCDIADTFFDSLKEDYPEFEKWYIMKSIEGMHAFTYSDEYGLGAFVMLKFDEKETIKLKDRELPKCNRLKISTLKLSERIQGNRLGEGAIGIALWHWLESDDEEIYVTVFNKHKKLIDLLMKFGFTFAGYNLRDEGVYIRSKEKIDFSTPYTSFPFINNNQDEIAILPIEDEWHDKLFPYSELKNTKQETEEFSAANGMTKTYLCFAYQKPKYKINQPIMIYRKHNGNGKKYKSVVTSYGTIVKFETIKENRHAYKSFEQYIEIVGNKSIFTDEDLHDYYNKNNLYVLELVYDHAFGKGNNVTYHSMVEEGIWADVHPYQAVYTMEEFKKVLIMANQDINKLIK